MFYGLLVRLSNLLLWVASFFSSKIERILLGRKKTWSDIHSDKFPNFDKKIWFHVSSVGEFEQALPLIKWFKENHANVKIYVSFFSSSGYEQCSLNPIIDYAFYLPSDTKRNAQKLLKNINPLCLIFVKYDLWYNVINELSKSNIPLFLVSSVFRKDQVYFRWYGGVFRKMLKKMTMICVQNARSKMLLKNILSNHKIVVTGDTRHDRVVEIADTIMDKNVEDKIRHWVQGKFTIVLGSVIPKDDEIFKPVIQYFKDEIAWLIVPHTIDEKRLQQLKGTLEDVTFFTDLDKGKSTNVFVVDTYGMLAKLYRYGQIAYVGGGFVESYGLHNVLEPSAYNLPVLIGKYYDKFIEVEELADLGTCIPCQSSEDLIKQIKLLRSNPKTMMDIKTKLTGYFEQKKGSAIKIASLISERVLK